MIRNGIVNDLPEIIEMSREFWKHTIYDEEFCPDTVEAMATLCIDQGLMCVLDVNGEIKGFACGIKGGLLANSEVFSGTELAWWVDPSHRQGRNGIGLLKGLERQAKEAGVKYWNMIFMESSMPSVIEGIYLKMGYNKAEVAYTKVL